MMKLNYKQILGFMCLGVACVGVSYYAFQGRSVLTNVSAEKLTDVTPGQNEYNAIVNCGSDNSANKEILIQYFEFQSEFDNNNLNNFKVTVKRGKFKSQLNVGTIKSNSNYIYKITDKNGNEYGDNEYIYIDSSSPIYVYVNRASNADDTGRTHKILFDLADDVFVTANGNKYGCVSIDTYSALKTAEGNGDYDSVLAGHPTLKDKPYGYDYSSFSSYVIFEVPLNINPQSPISVDNDYYNTICSDFRGDTRNGYLEDNVLDKIADIKTNSEAYSQLQNGYNECWQTKVSGNPNASVLKTLLQDIVISTWTNYFGVKKITGSDEELANFRDDNYFKMVKENAKNAVDSKNGSHYLYNAAGSVSSKTFQLKCASNPNADFNTTFLEKVRDASGKLVYNIGANKDYFYASTVDEPKEYKYIQSHFTQSSGEEKSIKIGQCQKSCEEAVIVEYGPPIASTAGVCFEYQVQVTSKIKCEVKSHWEPIPSLNMCTPAPQCNYFYGFTHQGGPTEEFDLCINQCDGGEYSEKCSNKCYNEVYNKPSSKFVKQSFISTPVIATKVGDVNEKANTSDIFAGRYTMDSYGNIAWLAGTYEKDDDGKEVWVPSKINTYARYYKIFEYNRTINDSISGIWHDTSGALYYYADSYGFKRAYYGGYSCNDYCYFYGCGKDTYLNEKELNDEKDAYLKERKAAIAECSASASCTTKTAKFTMNVKYDHMIKKNKDDKNKTKETVTIEFPYDTKEPDKITTVEKENDSCSGNPKTKLASGNHTILNYAGCYKNCGKDDGYHTRWSFPGGWRNTKSGDISYEDKSSDSHWTKFPDKFCIPADAMATNKDYFNFYYTHKLVPSYTDENGKSIFQVMSYDPSKIDYNIHAKAEDFGHYGWNFEFSCFYALSDSGSSGLDYSIRTVDLVDLFPDKDGISHNNPQGFNTPNDKMPFNWSTRAVQNNNPLPSAASDPTVYGEYVQTKGYDVYNDDELEYHFHLTPSTMRDLNKKSANVGNGKSIVKNGISTYRSSLIRDDASLSSAVVRIPDESVLGCNNIHGVKDGSGSGQCMTINEIKTVMGR